MKPGSIAHEIAYERWLLGAAEKAFNALPVCPWCGCESVDEDNCDECGLNMAGEPFLECIYCGKEHTEESAKRGCCGEVHIEMKYPPCPKCGSNDLEKAHGFTACGVETDYRLCMDCGHQWDFQ